MEPERKAQLYLQHSEGPGASDRRAAISGTSAIEAVLDGSVDRISR